MATTSVKVNVVDVGQGQCTFVEVYNGVTLLHTLLFDCGSDKHKKSSADENLNYIVSKTKDKNPTFDYIFFSHSDKDHISLLDPLLKKYINLTPSVTPTIGKILYGGNYDNYTKGKKKFNILNEAEKYCNKNNINSVPENKTDYDKTKNDYGRIRWESADKAVKVYVIGCNLLSDLPDFDDTNDDDVEIAKTAEQKNHVSMVCSIYFANTSYVICGDATNGTMAAINNLFDNSTTVFNNNVMTTVPHHGSRATGLSVKSADKANLTPIKVIKTFSSLMKSKSLSVSSFQKHKHSSLELLTYFPPTSTNPMVADDRLTVKNNHLMVLYDDVKLKDGTGKAIADGYHNVATSSNIFGTNYSLTKPEPTFSLGFDSSKVPEYTVPSVTDIKANKIIDTSACWVYTTLANRTTTLEGWGFLGGAKFTSSPTVATPNIEDSIQDIALSVRPVAGSVAKPAAITPKPFSSQFKAFR